MTLTQNFYRNTIIAFSLAGITIVFATAVQPAYAEPGPNPLPVKTRMIQWLTAAKAETKTAVTCLGKNSLKLDPLTQDGLKNQKNYLSNCLGEEGAKAVTLIVKFFAH
jgi:hypothetical protein